MKANVRIPLDKDSKKIVERILDEAEESIKQDQQKAISRVVKFVCIALNQHFGFGAERLGKLLNYLSEYSNEVTRTPERWYSYDEHLHKIGMLFDDEDIEEREQHSKDIYAAKGRKFRQY